MRRFDNVKNNDDNTGAMANLHCTWCFCVSKFHQWCFKLKSTYKSSFLVDKNNKKDGYRQLNVRQLGSLRPCDHRGKCYMDRKRIQCLSNASQHVHILSSTVYELLYSEILVGNRNFFLHPCI